MEEILNRTELSGNEHSKSETSREKSAPFKAEFVGLSDTAHTGQIEVVRQTLEDSFDKRISLHTDSKYIGLSIEKARVENLHSEFNIMHLDTDEVKALIKALTDTL